MSLPERIESVLDLDNLVTTPSSAVVSVLSRVRGPVLVVGAGGKMGYHLCLLLKRGLLHCGNPAQVVAISRFNDEDVRRQFTSAGLEVIAADASLAADVGQLPEAEVVFFLAGVKFGTANHPDLLQQMNVKMPGLIAERFKDSKIVALSTGCVYSFVAPDTGGSTEHSRVDPPGEYALSCLQREQEFTARSLEYGTPVSLIRLNYSVETRYGVLVDIALKVFHGEPVDVSMGYVNVIWQGDALDHIVQSLALVSVPPLILNVTGSDILKVRDLADGFSRRFGKPARITGQEGPTALLNNAGQSHQQFGPPVVPVEKMMDWIADWLQRSFPILSKPTHFEVRSGAY